jgi:hypothetical protein
VVEEVAHSVLVPLVETMTDPEAAYAVHLPNVPFLSEPRTGFYLLLGLGPGPRLAEARAHMERFAEHDTDYADLLEWSPARLTERGVPQNWRAGL